MTENNLIASLYKKSNWVDVYQFADLKQWETQINQILINPYQTQDDSFVISNLDVLYVNGGNIESMINLILYAKELLKNSNTKNNNKKLKLFIGIKYNRASINSVKNANNIVKIIESNVNRKLNDEEISYIQLNNTNE